VTNDETLYIAGKVQAALMLLSTPNSADNQYAENILLDLLKELEATL
jgi:hypothetical protein